MQRAAKRHANRKGEAPKSTQPTLRSPLKLGKCRSQQPIVKRKDWPDLPQFIALYAERGPIPKCWDGHRLCKEAYDQRKHQDCTYCEKRASARSTVLVCRKCPWWLICSACVTRPRLPKLEHDPLFFGPRTPRLLSPDVPVASGSRGTVIICPGGNYQFLVPHEGLPAAEWLARQGIRAYVLRYRLLPTYGLRDMLADLSAAVELLRGAHGGPVAAMGFSAGGHLVASQQLKRHREAAGCAGRPDVQVLVYPCVDGSDWGDEESCGFWGPDFDRCLEKAKSLLEDREALLGGPGFAAPPTFLVASTKDEASPPKQHTDLYAAALKKSGVPDCCYLRRNYGPHGFGLAGGWTESCTKWLRARGFGSTED
eukprot:TRINITY_DN98492_c0_g1_i1.p1 TRINITY_DN98492_c0_g1~~TRINITY_DN98492_c0_g1_i1.p1  ORF type:complete len:383 (+),score=67.91 TRINITY_DN98492_c0_g1_i1:48-1151(+)